MLDNCIGILTFHKALNFGAVMQCYSLQEAIGELGYSTQIIDYSSDALNQSNSLRIASAQINPKGIIAYVLKYPNRAIQYAKYRAFVEANLSQSIAVERESLGTLCQYYSRVVVGSDQVWNPKLTGYDAAYLLDFAPPEKRVAYAASVGMSCFPDNCEDIWSDLIRDFHAVSVRESSLMPYLDRLTKSVVFNACDPVLLHDGSWWKEAFAAQLDSVEIRCGKHPYVLAYCVSNPDTHVIRAAKNRAASCGCDIVAIHKGALPVKGVKNIRNAGPLDILSLFLDAQAVVTNSFHGCCFSVVLGKEFGFLTSNTAGEKTVRIIDLLEKLHLSNSILANPSQPLVTPSSDSENQLVRWRKQSLAFLADAIN